MEERRRPAAEKEAAARRATEKQILKDADHPIAVWNERQAKRMPMLFSPTISAAIAASYWFLWARCPACRTTGDVDLRSLDWHRGTALTALIPALSCRSCRPQPLATCATDSVHSPTGQKIAKVQLISDRGFPASGRPSLPVYKIP
jgi:hypothetical protein